MLAPPGNPLREFDMIKATDRDRLLGVYRAMRLARGFDEQADLLGRQGEVRFQLSGAGHEGLAAAAPHLGPGDWLHPHYRDKGLMIARGLTAESFFHALLATGEADAKGRRMPPFVCSSPLHILSIPTLVGNNALQAVGVAAAVAGQPEHPIVLAGIGDGGTQQGEFLEALGEAARARLPVLFLVEHNDYALSTPTAGRTFYDLNGEAPDAFLGVPILRVDGSDPVAVDALFRDLVPAMRRDRSPRIVVARVARLASHSNSDDESVYRTAGERARARETSDPVARLRTDLLSSGVKAGVLDRIDSEAEEDLRKALDAARAAPAAPSDSQASRPLPERCARADSEVRLCAEGSGGLTLLEALRETLRARLADDPRVTLYGQDLEDPKGDVFGVTRGLSTEFAGRVVNAPLSEATIAGVSVGRALAGGRPVAFLQFADFFPVAFNQIHSELAALHWRSAGQWDAPVVLMAVTGGYRPGLGPYHAQTPEAYMLHTPGLDVFMPATAADAAGLLNSAFESGRPSVFFYPKNLLNERASLADAEVRRQFVPIGHARVIRAGTDVTLVGWGNTVSLCEQAAAALETAGVQAEVLDLRTLSPWDRRRVTASAARTGRLIVVHEDTRTCGLGAEILATVSETSPSPVRMARITAPDGWLPYNFDAQLAALPGFRNVLECAAGMLELDLRWEEPAADPEGEFTLRAAGSSPSDERVRILAWQVTEGQKVREGDALASAEADKAAFDMSVPVSGTVEKLLVAEGEPVLVGEPIVRIRLPRGASRPAAFESRERKPVLTRRAPRPARPVPEAVSRPETPVTLSTIASVLGSRVLENDALLRRFPEWNAADIVQRTGIEKRYWVGEGETALSLAVRAARECLAREGLEISDLDALICSTGTPMSMTPSLACRVLKELSPERGEVMAQAWDINAACSGYLYALQSAYDFLTNRPEARVLVLTAETLSPVLDPSDPGTLFLFGDGATASLVSRDARRPTAQALVHRPVLSAKGEDESILYVPFPGKGEFLQMSGQQVFRVAVRKMIDMLEQACQQARLGVGDLAMVVPHQANTRIIEAIREKIKLPPERMFNHIREYANTSSNTIPLALQTVLAQQPAGARIGLCAFGGGFTFGAGILERL